MAYIIRVYKDVEMETDDKNQAIEMATYCLSDFDTEIIEEINKPKTTQEYFNECLTRLSRHVKR